MSDILLEPNKSSPAIDEPLMRYIVNSRFFSLDFLLENFQNEALRDLWQFLSRTGIALQRAGLQSSSVSRNGYLWQNALARIFSEASPLTVRYSESRTETNNNAEQMKRNYALIQLLRSWREGDEQEQRDTWQYLKQALDEDRLSDRKLFP